MKLIHKLQSQSKLQWLFLLLICVFSVLYHQRKNGLSSVISSDGTGYYAYLPALFIYHDNHFEKTAKAEREIRNLDNQQHYLILNKQGKKYNKCLPGIAVLQTPFFLLSCFFAWIFGQTIDGYSDIFIIGFYLGSLFYTLTGIFFFNQVLKRLFPESTAAIQWIVPLFYLATPILYYSIHTPSISHGYSFFLFALFAWLILKLKENFSLKFMVILGFTLGAIALIRPTNILVVLIVPFLLGSWEETKRFITLLFQRKSKWLILGVFAFISIISILFLSWKWQTGNWIIGAYNGEGFNFGKAMIFQSLFSFRIGLFLHSPIFILTFLGLILLFFQNRFKAFWFLTYFGINVYVIASWWCWDYESSFGARPYTEHAVFLILPILELLTHWKKWVTVSFVFFAVIGANRLYASLTGIFVNQRFTKQNYLGSLNIWDKKNHDRWNFTFACAPFGEKVKEFNLNANFTEIEVKPTDLYVNTVDFNFPADRKNKRFYVTAEIEKKNFSADWSDVFLVIDAHSKDEKLRHYQSIPLYNDRFEGKNNWTKFVFEESADIDCLKQYDVIRIYIFNSGKKHFSLKNAQFKINVYQSK
jgi:hypothetical protein